MWSHFYVLTYLGVIERFDFGGIKHSDAVVTLERRKQDAQLFFQFIYDMYDKTAFILTSNKGPKE